MRINFVVIEDKVEQILRGWETTASEQSFADMTLQQFEQALQPYCTAKAAFVTISTRRRWSSRRASRLPSKAIPGTVRTATCTRRWAIRRKARETRG